MSRYCERPTDTHPVEVCGAPNATLYIVDNDEREYLCPPCGDDMGYVPAAAEEVDA